MVKRLWAFFNQSNIFVTHIAKISPLRQTAETKKAPRGAFFFGNLFAARDAEAFVETLNTTTGINNTLFTSKERVAFAAHVQVQVVAHGGVGFDHITARTGCSNRNVIRVNTFFHGKPQFKAASLFQP
ncbi:hypothetical protein LG58_3863 [Kosakonia radicincitans YD4]|nr:hypothetical protein LG58_3863 [Kosakonia radicincitans YD4]